MEVFWLEATPWDPATASAVTIRACSHDLAPIVHFGGGQEWLPVLASGPIFGTTVFTGQFGGRAEGSRGEVELAAADGLIDAWDSYIWQSRSVKIWRGTIDNSNPLAPVYPGSQTLMFDGIADLFDSDEALLRLVNQRPNGKVAKSTYAGTGGVEALVEMKGAVKPFAAGVQKNRPALMIDPGTLLFQAHGYGEVAHFVQFREGGMPLDQRIIFHPTSASLLAATVPETEIHVCKSLGLFRLGFTPFGQISWDGYGHIVLGPELVTSGTFDATTGWTVPASAALTLESGRGKVRNTGAAQGYIYQSVTVVVGQKYTVEVAAFTGSVSPRVKVGTAANGTQYANNGGDTNNRWTFTATTTTLFITLMPDSAVDNAFAFFDSVTVRLGEFKATLGTVVQQLLSASGWNMSKIDAGSFTTVDAINDNAVQFYDESGLDILDAVTTLMAGAGGYWDVDALGNFYIGLVQSHSTVSASIGEQGAVAGGYELLEIDFLPRRSPIWKTRVGYGFNPLLLTFEVPIGATAEQLALIEKASDLTDGVTTVFFATVEPVAGMVEGDLWHNTTTGIWSRYLGGSWSPEAGLGALGVALLAAAGAQATADGKVTTFFTDSTPGAPAEGDLWIRPSDNPKVIKRWSGSTWDVVSQGYGEIYGNPVITIKAKSSGEPETGQVPRFEYYRLTSNGISFLTGVTADARVMEGGLNSLTPGGDEFGLDVTDGNAAFVINTIEEKQTQVEIRMVHSSGVSAKRLVTVNREDAPPQVGDSGGSTGTNSGGTTAAQTSAFPSLNSASYVVISNVLTMTLGPAATAAAINVNLAALPVLGSEGDWTVGLKVFRETSPGTWTQVGTTRTRPSQVYTLTYLDGGGGIPKARSANFAFIEPVTGLTAGTTQKFRVEMAITVSSPSLRSHSITGQVSIS